MNLFYNLSSVIINNYDSVCSERPDPPASLEVIEIGSRSIRLLWRRAFDGNSPIRNYVIQYRSLNHGLADDWNPAKTHNVTYTPGHSNNGNTIHPTQNGNCISNHEKIYIISIFFLFDSIRCF